MIKIEKPRKKSEEIKYVRIKCKKCYDIIEHNGEQGFVACECTACAIDYIKSASKDKWYIKVLAWADFAKIVEIEYKDIGEE